MRILNPPKIKDVARLGPGSVFTVLSSDRSTAYLVVILDQPTKSGLREWCSCPANVECRHLKLAKESR
jgi:hypothetical protein